MDILLPCLNKRRQILGYAEDFCSMDGEQTFLDAAMKDEVIAQCRLQNTSLAMYSAAKTALDQPCDASKGNFRGNKNGIAKVAKNNISTENVLLENRIYGLLSTSVDATPGCEDAKQTTEYRRSLAECMCTIVFFMKNSDSYTPVTIQNSYIITGQHAPLRGEDGFIEPRFPFFGVGTLTVNVEKMLRKFIRNIEDAEMAQMIESLPEGVDLIRGAGTLTRAEMDHLKIPRLPEGLPLRENLTLCRQGAVLITHAATLERNTAYREAKRPRTQEEKDAAIEAKEQEKALANAQKIVDGAGRVEIARKRRADEALAEKERKAALSSAERKSEIDAKRMKKEEKRLLKEQKLLDAKNLVENT